MLSIFTFFQCLFKIASTIYAMFLISHNKINADYHKNSNKFQDFVNQTAISYQFQNNTIYDLSRKFAQTKKDFSAKFNDTMTNLTRINTTLFLDYTSEPGPQNVALGGSTGNIWHSDDPENPQSLFLSGEVTVRPWEQGAFKLFAGASKAGLRCAGGVCSGCAARR